MASVKFTTETIEVACNNISYYANQMIESLQNDESIDALDNVDTLKQKIQYELECIDHRLRECDEY